MEHQYILKTNALTKKYHQQTAVSKVSLNIEKGRIYGLLGRNGAGKTTIMKMILGLVSITSGEITLFNQPLKSNEKNIYPRIGSIIETPGFYSHLTAAENLNIFARLRGTINENAVSHALTITGLPARDKKPFSSYSLGMKQRLGIANAILNDPELLILDEPTNGLDPVGIADIRNFLRKLSREQEKTILISSHLLSEISLLADDIGIIHEGSLLEETSAAELEQRNRKYIEVVVDNIAKAAQVLEEVLSCRDYLITEHNLIRIYDLQTDTVKLAALLVKHEIGIVSIGYRHENLEDYFRKITGGEEHDPYIYH